MKCMQIYCPVCHKRMLFTLIRGKITFSTKCQNCSKIIEVVYNPKSKPRISKRMVEMNTS